MAFYTNSDVEARPIGFDLSAIMRQVYLWMALGLVVGFGVAYLVGNAALTALESYNSLSRVPISQVSILFNPIVMIVSLIAYIVLAFALQPIMMRASPAVGAAAYLLFTAVFGFMISSIFLQYAPGTIALALISTAAMFGATSIFGYTTKIDLSQYRGILMMALIGLVIASIVNIFFANNLLFWVINYAGVLIFVGLTAYDTQWIKNYAAQAATANDPDMGARIALVGAFHLFLDFVILFLFILRILGGRRR